MALSITDKDYVNLHMTDRLKGLRHICIALTNNEEWSIEMVINKQEAQEIIEHLEKQFNL